MALETIVREGVIIPIGTHEGKKIVLACDHRGYAMKQELLKYAHALNCETLDLGTYSPARCDYPEYAAALGKMVSDNYVTHVGIAICGSGNGMGIVVGKFPYIHAARCRNSHPDAFFARKHNNSNVLLLGAEGLPAEEAQAIFCTWFSTPFYEGPQDDVYLNRYLKTVKIEQEIYGGR